jgi:hypothetical protein
LALALGRGAAVAFASSCAIGHPAGIQVAGSAEVGSVAQSDLVVGHDGGHSGLLFGHSVWLYGDTALSLSDATGSNFHSNSFAWTDNLNASSGVTGFHERLDSSGAPEPMLDNTDDEAAFNKAHAGSSCAVQPCGARWAIWPTAVVFDGPRTRALIFYELIDSEPGAWNFHSVGRSIAIWSDFNAPAERPVVSPGTAHPTLLFGQDEPSYGDAAAVDGDSLYVFACSGAGLDEARCALGRAALADSLNRASYEFWDGTSWTSNIADARPVLSAGSGLSVFRFMGQWVASYTRPVSNDVAARTAPALLGPWSDEVQLFTANRKGDSGWTYDAYAHAELTPESGKSLYFSFTRPNHQGLFGSETALVRVDVK